MFTGIVEDRGTVTEIKRRAKESTLTFRANRIDLREMVTGESIAVNGACLTVNSLEGGTFTVDASRETLSRTNLGKLRVGSMVNLERSLRVGDRMGGHIVSGHVDGVGSVKRIGRSGGNRVVAVTAPKAISKYIARKGSITMNGVSLT
ncbi:MAG TPA: riboflavin synthase, partial [Thermodesulfobacteriota bacterium]|nr:riboflavin synthase [Thermodesulfobacteriota bacterium]